MGASDCISATARGNGKAQTFGCTSECANDLFRQCRHYMLGGLQPQERRTSDGPAAAPASTLFRPEAVIGFDPTQASGSTWSYAMQTGRGSPRRYQPML